MNRETAERLANEIRKDIEENPLHYGDVEVEVTDTIGVGWMVQVY